ncbi:predicted protein [Sclerotinia sclerotiorum 1980 UF-70]|uniref:Uncharacterized protein n=1 Tax=Sclerotinia sclerotiorum (strain ATCC 18683 / 1980 / Ss-1) TaxID=665079 RepID=A7EAP9_SCLS1|nr:predicted protein [Sclerotinia sclerotiorum 1980 UF-70]EDN99527.1 predicted protein [Sclerotinia sclerotiorum 1980 UF-70]
MVSYYHYYHTIRLTKYFADTAFNGSLGLLTSVNSTPLA